MLLGNKFMKAYILTIGDEILIGQITDTNSSWMSRELNLSGIEVVGKSSVGDNAQAIVIALEHASVYADVVIMTGGLGPTKDDITKKTLAAHFNSDMCFDETTYSHIEQYFTKIGRVIPESMRDQATLPELATILANKVGSAPGMWFEESGKVVISLPGVPFEMEYLMSAEVIPRLLARFARRPIVHRTVLTACEGESAISKRLEDFENNLSDHLKLAYLPAVGQVRLRITGIWDGPVVPGVEEQLVSAVEQKKVEMVALLPDLVFGYEEESLPIVIGRILLERGIMMGTAESCTGGYIASQITEVAGASAYFNGSAIAYSYELKEKLLGVRPETLAVFGAVSEECVREMAEGALVALGVGVSVAVSGIAGPGGGTIDKPVGTVWMAVADHHRTRSMKVVFGRDRIKNIQLTSTYALNMLRQFLLEDR